MWPQVLLIIVFYGFAQKCKLLPSLPPTRSPPTLSHPEDDWWTYGRSLALQQGSCTKGINIHEERLAFVHKSYQKDGLRLREIAHLLHKWPGCSWSCLNTFDFWPRKQCWAGKAGPQCLAPVTGIFSPSSFLLRDIFLQKGEVFLFEIISFPSFSKQMDRMSWMNKWERMGRFFGNSVFGQQHPTQLLDRVQPFLMCSCSVHYVHPCPRRATGHTVQKPLL